MNIEDKPELEKYVVTVNTLNHSNGEIVFEKIPNAGCEIRHGFTVHSIQGETATNKLYIDVTGIRDLRMLYTALLLHYNNGTHSTLEHKLSRCLTS